MWIGLVVNDVLTEQAAYTTTRLAMTAALNGVDFAEVVIRDLERKAKYKQYYDSRLSNVEMVLELPRSEPDEDNVEPQVQDLTRALSNGKQKPLTCTAPSPACPAGAKDSA